MVTPQITRTVVRERGLVGALYTPSEVARPVLCLGGSDGGLAEGTARVLATEGFAALALAYFAAEGLPSELERVPLEYLAGALRWLRARPDSTDVPPAVLGGSKGAEAALLTAATFPELAGPVVAWSPTSVAWQAITLGDPRQMLRPPRSSWTLGGDEVPYVRLSAPLPSDFIRLRWMPIPVFPFRVLAPAWEYPTAREAYRRAYDNERAVAQARIPVERAAGPLLLFSAAEDGMWPSDHFAEEIRRRLGEHGRADACEHVTYDDAGHQYGLPFSGAVLAREGPFIHGGSLGGSLAGNGHMLADSWDRALAFLDQNLR